MNRLPLLKAKDLIRILNKLGFMEVRQKGSHLFFRHFDGRTTVAPIHSGEDISRGLLHQILREISLSPKDFMNLYKDKSRP